MKSTIQLNYKNISKADLRYRSCSFRTGADLSQTVINIKQSRTDGVTYDLARNFILCGPSAKKTISFKSFERRKSKVENVEISTLFGATVPDVFQI
jgi:hypothetical protein